MRQVLSNIEAGKPTEERARPEMLWTRYTMFGDGPWIAGSEGREFSAWDYARQRAAEICAAGANPDNGAPG